MNTDYSESVKNHRDNYNYNDLLSLPQLSQYETDLAKGQQYFRIVYSLFVANGMIWAFKMNRDACWKTTLFTLAASYPLSLYTCKYLLGYDKLRRIHKLQSDTYNSAKLYEKEIENAKL